MGITRTRRVRGGWMNASAQARSPWFFEWMANGDGGGTTARGRSPRPIPLSEHKISGHKSSTIRPPLVALVPVLHRGWYLVHEIDHVGETEVGRQRSVPRSEDGTGRMERAVLPPRPCRLLDALDPYLIFLCWPTERNFPFLLSPPPRPPSWIRILPVSVWKTGDLRREEMPLERTLRPSA